MTLWAIVKATEIIIKRIRDQIDKYNKQHSGIPQSISIGLAVSDGNDQALAETSNEADHLM